MVTGLVFRDHMVRATLAGKKCLDLRVKRLEEVNENLPVSVITSSGVSNGDFHVTFSRGDRNFLVSCPYGMPGHQLFVKESWQRNGNTTLYRATADPVLRMRWKPAITMSKRSARLFLSIKSLRCDRLFNLTEQEAIDFGVDGLTENLGNDQVWFNYLEDCWDSNLKSPIDSVMTYWDAVYGDRCPSSSNPFVWLISYLIVQAEEARGNALDCRIK